MAHYKNRKPKSFKGCCTMCSYRSTDGTRNGRKRTRQELAARLGEAEQQQELDNRDQRAASCSVAGVRGSCLMVVDEESQNANG